MNLKEHLLESYNQYCDEQVEDYVLEQFGLYLQAEGMELTEDILQEGKITDAIRWKLAKFSLRFLKENSLNEFLSAYYADKDGKPTEKSREWIKKKKKEKVKKLRELAENLKPEEKDKVIKSEAAKQLEKKAVMSGVFAGIAGISAGVAYQQSVATSKLSNKAASDASNNSHEDISGTSNGKVDTYTSSKTTTSSEINGDISGTSIGRRNATYNGDSGSLILKAGETTSINNIIHTDTYYSSEQLKSANPGLYTNIKKNFKHPEQYLYNIEHYHDGPDGYKINYKLNPNVSDMSASLKATNKTVSSTMNTVNSSSSNNFSGKVSSRGVSNILGLASTLLSSLSSLFFGVMWGSLIVAGIQGVRAGVSAHKANVMRRDEILQQLISKKDLKEEFIRYYIKNNRLDG